MPEDLTRLQTIFTEALAQSAPADRAAYLDRACADDADLRLRLDALLAAHESPDPFLNLPPQRVEEQPGAVIGRYKLLEQIGEGGFGVVFMAEQEQPIRRRVALKIIKLGMDTRQVVARFEAERQALAMMDHPGIAKVFDAGATDSGRPYFVMELVKGVPITEFCDKNHLSIRERLDLFMQVCQAVQHAHQKGLIHRDIKPSNVLVNRQDTRAVAKVIDFGIAKATEARLTEKTLFTGFHQMVGTPEYMSPEQADGALDIDTRSDIYSLGVLLYDLLTGTPPFDAKDLRSKVYAEMQRIIREVDPPTPSTRLGTNESLASIAARRSIEPRELRAMLRGELDWIAMKCLEKDRSRRYESASALAGDLQRYLAHEPVQAAAPSGAYRLRKFVRRNRVLVIASLIVLVTLLAGIIGTTIGLIGQSRQRVIAERERAEAQRQADEAKRMYAVTEAVGRFQEQMLQSADPGKGLGDKVTVLQAITAAMKELDEGKLKDQPIVEAFVRTTIGNTLRSLGRYDLAEPNMRRALELRRKSLPAGDTGIALSANDLAVVLQLAGQTSEAEALYREALQINRAKLPAIHTDLLSTVGNLATLLQVEGKLSEAEPLAREVLDIRRKTLPPTDGNLAFSLNNLAFILQAEGKLDQAEPLYREALDIWQKSSPRDNPNIATAMINLGVLQSDRGKPAEAEQTHRAAVDCCRKYLPADHPLLASALTTLANDLWDQKKLPEAETLLRESLNIRRRSLPADHPDVTGTIRTLAKLLQEEGKFAESELLYRKALSSLQKSFGENSWEVGNCRLGLGRTLAGLRRHADAEEMLMDAERILATAKDAPPGRHEQAVQALASLYAEWNESDPTPDRAEKARHWHSLIPPPSTKP